MAKIYDQERNRNQSSYRGYAQSRPFNPVQVADKTRAIQDRNRQELDNLAMADRAAKRQERLDSSQLKFESDQGLRNLQQNAKLVQDISSLSKTVLTELGGFLEKREKEQQAQDNVDAAFGVGEDFAAGTPNATADNSKQGDIDNAQATVATEKETQGIDSPNAAESARGAADEQTSTFRVRRGNAYQVAQQFPGYYNAYVNDTSRVYTRPDGSTFTSATIRDSADVALIDASARRSFYNDAGIAGLPTNQVSNILVPVVTNVGISWTNTANTRLIEGRTKQRGEDAKVGIWNALEGGEDLTVLFQNGASELFASGGYVGAQGEANRDTVKTILDWAIRNNRPDVIEGLKGVEKVPGNKGTKLGNQYADLFEEAAEGVIDESLSDDQRERDQANNGLLMTERERQAALAAAETPEDEVRINEEFAERLRGLGTPEGDLAGAKLEANLNYSPFTALDMEQQQQQGAVFTNEELATLVEAGEITSKEAQGLGWNPSGGSSAGQEAQTEAKTYKSDTDSVGRSAVTAALQSGAAMLPEEIQLQLQGQGKLITNDISARLQAELARKIANGELADDADRRAWIARRGAEMAAEVTKDENGQLQYTFGGPGASNSDPIATLQPTLVHPQTKQPALDLRGRDPSELATRPGITIYGAYILSERELFLAQEAVRTGKPIPAGIEAKAQALGTNGRNLLRGQENLHGMDQAVREERPAAAASNYQSSGDLAQYDTGSSYGGVSLDKLRNSVIGNESGGNYRAVNPDSGALGYGQVMPANVPSWSRAALGYTISTRQFLSSPQLQMQIINHRFESMMQEQIAAGYSGEELARRVASIWYSGQPGLWNNTNPQTYNGQSYPSIANYTLDIWKRYQGG